MYKQVINLYSDEIRTCHACGDVNVRQQDNCEWVCESCGTWCEGHLVQDYKNMGTTKPTKGHDPVAYRYKLFKPLAEPNINCIPDDIEEALNELKKSDFTWTQAKKLIPPGRTTRNERLYTLPTVLGFKFTWYPEWLRMVELVQVQAKAIWGAKTKINNVYTLYQCVALSGYHTDWIPISLTATKQRELNRKWLRITKELEWRNEPMKLSKYVDQECIDNEDFEEAVPVFPKFREITDKTDEAILDCEGTEEIVSDEMFEPPPVSPTVPQDSVSLDQLLASEEIEFDI